MEKTTELAILKSVLAEREERELTAILHKTPTTEILKMILEKEKI